MKIQHLELLIRLLKPRVDEIDVQGLTQTLVGHGLGRILAKLRVLSLSRLSPLLLKLAHIAPPIPTKVLPS